ncbi:PREDICTED: tudor domain-containing protein 1-like [Branchiostoma belcheri]|uniref:Tudor domain-containing protein 1-like n=1 Tax=Branchiostoma belcheri TaxID=7741 RepID=A0A6P4YBJ2_BRABE|nr:PREDICTED: tudor domain-containing protein 1-like [Branchiostoma belcheri]
MSQGKDLDSLGSWNPMEEDFTSPTFNSYDRGPGANFPNGLSPASRNGGDSDRSQSENISLYVSGIPLEMEADGVKHFFGQVATPVSVRIMSSKSYENGSTYCFVDMASVRDADAVMREFDQKPCGRFKLTVRPSNRKPQSGESRPSREPQKVSLYATQGQSQRNYSSSDSGSQKDVRSPQPAIRTLENRYGKSSSPAVVDRDPRGRRLSGGADSPPPLDGDRPTVKRSNSSGRLDMAGYEPGSFSSFSNKYSQFKGSMAGGRERSPHTQAAVPESSTRRQSYPSPQNGPHPGGVRRSYSQSNVSDRQSSGEFNRGSFSDRGYGRDGQVSPSKPVSQRPASFDQPGQTTAAGVRTSPSVPERRGGDRMETGMPAPQGSYTNGTREELGDSRQKPGTLQHLSSPEKPRDRATSPERPALPCLLCGQQGKSRCGRCKKPYCGKECQRKHWPEHKNHCRPVEQSEDILSGFENFDVSAGDDVKEKMDHLMALSGMHMVSVTEVVSPEDISVHIVHHETILKLAELMGHMVQTYEGTTNEGNNAYHPQAGELCAAKFSDGGWYRASVDGVNPDGTLAVTYVDFGNSESISVSRVRKLNPGMAKLPLLAVKCSLLALAGKGGSVWSPEMVNFLKTNIVNKECNVTMKEEQGGTALVDMVVIDTGKSVAEMVVESGLFVPCQKPPPPPQDPQEDFGFLVTHIDSPASFYGQVGLGADMKSVAEDLGKKMELIAGLPEAILQSNKQEPYMPQVGELCCALWETDRMWYRAEVVQVVSESQLKVFFLDYGNTETVTTANTRPIPDSFTQCPALALHCKLAGVSPVNSDSWSQQATGVFKDLTKDKLIMGTPVRREGDVLSVELKDFATGSAQKGRVQKMTRVKPPTSGRFDVLLKCVRSPGLFFCQLTEPSGVHELQMLINEITHHCQGLPMDPSYIPDIGEICCVNSPDGKTWLRAEVQEHRVSNKVQIECVDIGKQVQVSQARLRPALPQHTELPLQVFQASLAGVEPIGEWSRDATALMSRYVDNQRLTAKVVGQEGDRYLLDLWDCASGQECSLSTMLCEEGWANKIMPQSPEGTPPPRRKQPQKSSQPPTPLQNGHSGGHPSPVEGMRIPNGGVHHTTPPAAAVGIADGVQRVDHAAPPVAAVGTAGGSDLVSIPRSEWQEMRALMAQQQRQLARVCTLLEQLVCEKRS